MCSTEYIIGHYLCVNVFVGSTKLDLTLQRVTSLYVVKYENVIISINVHALGLPN